jgi:uncharacterized protein YeaO (DUF488 family)
MIKVKHLLDPIESDDGERIWIEPIGLTRDLFEMCAIDAVMSHLGPSQEIADELEAHPHRYDYFFAEYQHQLYNGSYLLELKDLARIGRWRNITLIHHGSNPAENSAVALRDFLLQVLALSSPL